MDRRPGTQEPEKVNNLTAIVSKLHMLKSGSGSLLLPQPQGLRTLIKVATARALNALIKVWAAEAEADAEAG